MKKICILLTISMFIFLSCSNNEEDNSTSINNVELINTWLLEKALLDGSTVSSSYKIQFTSTNRAKFYYKNPTSNTTFGPDIIENGNYTLNDSNLSISWDGSITSKYQILELTSSKLKLKSTIPGEGTLIETYTK